jgi:hypothetical protein
MRITPIVMIALMMNIFVLFGAPALVGDAPKPLAGHLLGEFVSGDMAHPTNLTMRTSNVVGWIDTTGGGSGLFSTLVGSIVSVAAVVVVFATFLAQIVLGMITFPFTIFTQFGLTGTPGSAMFAVILASVYMLLNITAAIELTSGRPT